MIPILIQIYFCLHFRTTIFFLLTRGFFGMLGFLIILSVFWTVFLPAINKEDFYRLFAYLFCYFFLSTWYPDPNLGILIFYYFSSEGIFLVWFWYLLLLLSLLYLIYLFMWFFKSFCYFYLDFIRFLFYSRVFLSF